MTTTTSTTTPEPPKPATSTSESGTGTGPGTGSATGTAADTTRPTAGRTSPGRPARGGPPGRHDPRRPGGGTGPAPRTATGRSPDRSPALPTADARRRARAAQPHQWFADQLLRTLSGQRPVHALLGHALPAAYDRLVELAPQAPLRPMAGARRAPAPMVRSCGVCRPSRGVIEAFARIASGERVRALAFRLELGADSRWRCAALDIGPSPAVWSDGTRTPV